MAARILDLRAKMRGHVFSGSDAFAETGRGGPIMGHQGDTIIVFRADLFQPLADYAEHTAALQQRVHATPPAPGLEEVLVPSDLEARTGFPRARDGIPVADDIWESLVELARNLGIAIE